MSTLLNIYLLFVLCAGKTLYEVTFEVSSLLFSDTDDSLWFRLCNNNNECGLFQEITHGVSKLNVLHTIDYISSVDLGDISKQGSLYLLTTGGDHICLSDIYIDGKNYDSGIVPACIDAKDNIYPRAECEVLIIDFESNDWKIKSSNPCSYTFKYHTTTTVPPMYAYSPDVAKRLCVYSMASYCSGSLGTGAAGWDCGVCLQQPQMRNITIIDNAQTEAQAFVGYDRIYGPSIVIAFAGTDPLSIKDWISDLTFFFANYTGCSDCKIHPGFYESYTSIATEIWEKVKILQDYYGSDTKLTITGHSLGGAMAVHCAIDSVINYGLIPSYVYTFGSPRIGNDNFAKYYANFVTNLFRVTYKKDPVPHLPFNSWGYTHLPKEIYYDTTFDDINSGYTVCDGSGEDDECSMGWSDTEAVDITNHLKYMGYDFTKNFLSCKLDGVISSETNKNTLFVNVMLYILFTLYFVF